MRTLRMSAFFGLILFGLQALAQNTQVDYDAIYKIKNEGFNNSEVMDIVWNLTDRIGPRLTGSPGLQNAYDWTSQKMKEMGLTNVKVDPWGEFGKGWEVEKSYVAMTVPYYQAMIGIPKAWTPGTGKLISSDVVYVDVTTEEDLAKYKGKLKGKIVVMPTTVTAENKYDADAARYTEEELADMESYPVRGGRGAFRYRGGPSLRNQINDMLKSEGVALVLSTNRGSQGTFFTSNGARTEENALPAIEMAPEHYNRMVRLLEKGEKVSVEAETKTRFFDKDTKAYNVVGELEGSDPALKNQVVMVGAHLDSWFAGTGATDNAAGSAVMMEVMRILKDSGVKLKRTVRIGLWSGEEQGIFGSRNYVQNTFMNDKTPNQAYNNFSAYYNMDNGTGAVRGIYLQGNDATRSLFEEWFKPFHELGAHTITSRNTGGTDHLAFDGIGLPGFQFIQDPISYSSRTHHSNMDVYDALEEVDLKKNAVIIAALVMQTANMDAKMPRKPEVASPSRR